ncbi:MAG TPA: hypothetical protein V6D07_18590 [Trichocoleus sp.]
MAQQVEDGDERSLELQKADGIMKALCDQINLIANLPKDQFDHLCKEAGIPDESVLRVLHGHSYVGAHIQRVFLLHSNLSRE